MFADLPVQGYLTPDFQNTSVGNIVVFECSIDGEDGYPKTHQYKWYPDYNETNERIAPESIFELEAKDEGYDGTYNCCPGNTVGFAPCGSGQLHVSSKHSLMI